ncbi:hypothetical protein P1J78_18130 [Psychromarinibacter sp. C21-152]|uniref:Uncharacterized protein n=1 Tax=Psychromarinibacter sediminicola TaxID=3033385 RepID=A0AAE3NUR9_9RHOB|nr:hypothetical protein [Psychromarinibacter sediminicola]MDF0602661.1 hypothetical protein [Psychromarinibacter sediminicola]
MFRIVLTSLIVLPLAACAQFVSRGAEAEPELRFGTGYRGSDDPCVRVGETALTAPYVSQDEDLVGCPVDFDGRPAFQIKTGGREVTRTADWVIYRVPLLGAPDMAGVDPAAETSVAIEVPPSTEL